MKRSAWFVALGMLVLGMLVLGSYLLYHMPDSWQMTVDVSKSQQPVDFNQLRQNGELVDVDKLQAAAKYPPFPKKAHLGTIKIDVGIVLMARVSLYGVLSSDGTLRDIKPITSYVGRVRKNADGSPNQEDVHRVLEAMVPIIEQIAKSQSLQ